jgi:hypothetical protein
VEKRCIGAGEPSLVPGALDASRVAVMLDMIDRKDRGIRERVGAEIVVSLLCRSRVGCSLSVYTGLYMYNMKDFECCRCR